MAIVQCSNPCFVTCLNGNCTPCPPNTDPNCVWISELNKNIDITKLECLECEKYAPQTEIGKAACLSSCQNPAGFSEEDLDTLKLDTQERNKKIIVVGIVLIVLVVIMFLLFSK